MQILSNYCLKKVDYEFLTFFDKFITKYPFKSYNLMEVLLEKDIVYIKDTTMIIDLLKINNNDVLNIFYLFKEMLRNGLISKIIFKKEVLFIFFKNDFITSFFKEKNKWLLIPLVNKFIDLEIKFYFDVFIKYNNVYNIMLLAKINGDNVLIDTKNILSSDLNYLIVNFYNNNGNNVKFSFDKNIFLENLYQKL